MTRNLTVAIVGATGAVGVELIRLLEAGELPVGELRLLASARSVGKTLPFRGLLLPVDATCDGAFAGVDLAFFSAGASRSQAFAPVAVRHGATVVDNSSAFRMDPDVPLVVPEINFHAIQDRHRIIANPNCSAIILLMAVAPLRALGRIRRIIVSTYQSASGAGAAAMEELRSQTATVLAGGEARPEVFDQPIAFNLFSHNTPIGVDGYNGEETKVIEETRKILEAPDLGVNVTCVRVPVMRAHSESITVEFDDVAPSVDAVREVLAGSPGVRIVDDRVANRFPTPLEASGGHDVLVGRIRPDLSSPRAICLFAAGDQLLKGAALNAVQIAERLMPLRVAPVSV
ncbi:MAG: aspartate-semialdehyde dehydrogenase [Fimbriimonadaceae bacterium]|nr:aspartate-semialdehyde dehydrogenase [Fimbriimonadaceae bacterium]